MLLLTDDVGRTMSAQQAEPRGAMKRKLVALPDEVVAQLQAAADADHPRPGKPGNVSAVVRDACETYLALRRSGHLPDLLAAGQ